MTNTPYCDNCLYFYSTSTLAVQKAAGWWLCQKCINADAEVRAKVGSRKEDCEEASNVVTVPLTRGQVAIIDAGDASRVLTHRWSAAWSDNNNRYYAARWVRREWVRVAILLHRFILNTPPGVQVDHKNLDTLDNRRVNLRLATPSQNQWNKPRQRNNRSGFKGVCWANERKKFRAQIKLYGAVHHIGYFNSAVEAAFAYDDAARRLHGEFARLNFS